MAEDVLERKEDVRAKDDYISRREFHEELAQFEQRIENRLNDFGDVLRANVREDNTRLVSEVNAKVEGLATRLEKEVTVLTAQTDQKVSTLTVQVEQKVGTLTAQVEQKVGTLTAQVERKVDTGVAEVKSDVKLLTERVDNLKSDYGELKKDTTELKRDMTEVKLAIADVKGNTKMLIERLQSIHGQFKVRFWVASGTIAVLMWALGTLIGKFLWK